MKYEKSWHKTAEGGWVLEARILNDTGKVMVSGSFELPPDIDEKDYAEKQLEEALWHIASHQPS